MGRYDKSYEIDLELDLDHQSAVKLQKKLANQAEKHILALQRIVDEFNLGDDLEAHMKGKILELRALFEYHGNP